MISDMDAPCGASWSGGKDSCLACWRAVKAGLEVRWLVTFTSKSYRRVRFHGISDELLRLQARGTGIELARTATDDEMDGYERGFRAGISALRERGMRAMVFGDIHLEEHRDWVEEKCAELGVRAYEPLWGDTPEMLIREFIDEGFRALVVSAMPEHFGPEVLGREIDHEFVDELLGREDIDVCGEQGEYHTFVFDGPLFERPVNLLETMPVTVGGHLFLNIYDYRLSAADEESG